MAYQLPLTARIGERWSATLTVDQPATWAGWDGRAQIRHHEGGPLLVELDVDLGVDGQVTVTVPDGATAALTPLTGRWDCYVRQGEADPDYIAEGPVTLTAPITVTAP